MPFNQKKRKGCFLWKVIICLTDVYLCLFNTNYSKII